jgi:Protein of unknown function (DUF3810)
MWRFAVIGVAIGAALAPLPAAAVEQLYSSAMYPALQRAVTAFSNLLPFALFDALLVSAVASWVWLLVRDITRRRGGWTRIVARTIARTVTAAAGLYLAFLVTWGLNYRRVPLADKLEFDASSVSAAAARTLATKAVVEVNRLHRSADRVVGAGVDPSLAGAFSRTQAELGISRTARPARPKRSILDLYFRRAAVDGMTDPYYLETLVVSDLLPFERSFVVAHEWSHLAGFADEGEANFVGWLTCLRGSPAAQYSAWLFLYREAIGTVRIDDRRAVADELAAGPREDLRAIAQRIQQHVSPALSAAGWQAYDRYLKANRVEAGTASYAEVVRLVLGTRFSTSWVPAMRRVPVG